jgi:hypothetical protein
MTMKVEDGSDEGDQRLANVPAVIALLLQMNEGDEMHTQHAGHAEPGVIYP